MTQIIEISSRISKSIQISQTSGAGSALVDEWKLLLERVGNAESVGEILETVSAILNDVIFSHLLSSGSPYF